MEAEARGVQAAIEWIKDMHSQNVDIECDSELVIKAIRSEVSYYLEVGHILNFCRSKLSNRLDLSICHIKKQANQFDALLQRVFVSSKLFVGDVID